MSKDFRRELLVHPYRAEGDTASGGDDHFHFGQYASQKGQEDLVASERRTGTSRAVAGQVDMNAFRRSAHQMKLSAIDAHEGGEDVTAKLQHQLTA